VRPNTGTSNFLSSWPVLATTTPNSTEFLPYIDPNPVGPIASADDRMMGYSFRLCVTHTARKQTPFFPPPNYNPSDFVLLSRYVQSLINDGSTGVHLGDIVDLFTYRNYPPGDKLDVCDSATAAFTTDAINLNKGYVEGCAAVRDHIYQNTYYYVLGMIWFLATDPSIPEFTRNNTLTYALCNDQWVCFSPKKILKKKKKKNKNKNKEDIVINN
jgi:hypothetical protein